MGIPGVTSDILGGDDGGGKKPNNSGGIPGVTSDILQSQGGGGGGRGGGENTSSLLFRRAPKPSKTSKPSGGGLLGWLSGKASKEVRASWGDPKSQDWSRPHGPDQETVEENARRIVASRNRVNEQAEAMRKVGRGPQERYKPHWPGNGSRIAAGLLGAAAAAKLAASTVDHGHELYDEVAAAEAAPTPGYVGYELPQAAGYLMVGSEAEFQPVEVPPEAY